MLYSAKELSDLALTADPYRFHSAISFLLNQFQTSPKILGATGAMSQKERVPEPVGALASCLSTLACEANYT